MLRILTDSPVKKRSERENIPGTIHAPTVSSRSGRFGSRGWNGWGAIDAFFRWLGRFFDRFRFGWQQLGCTRPLGNSIGTILLLAAIVAFFVCIFMLWVRRERGSGRGEAAERTRLGTAARLGDLPEGIRPADADPWAEANRRRAAGDLAGAVVCLFAYQLLILDQMGSDPARAGRTGRHYVASRSAIAS